ncbi:MAG: hypothetical protein B7Y80_17035 [Hyphomicrobium sp. 32-62-53]|nr:MAG: hypothetical protein B7Z29_08145 [Hyphomicrobium sp. 12-62-95]OYX98080.1 MAG: hypothetical protein B7Y80_17035 [Hyphomicrobium sp. 32-62-53]
MSAFFIAASSISIINSAQTAMAKHPTTDPDMCLIRLQSILDAPIATDEQTCSRIMIELMRAEECTNDLPGSEPMLPPISLDDL